MRYKVRNPNKGLMLGIMALAIIVLAVVVVFWMWCFPGGVPNREARSTTYEIRLSDSLAGDSLQLSVNDSVVWEGRAAAGMPAIEVSMPLGEHLLMVARPEADRLSSFDLPAEGGTVTLQKQGEHVEMEAH